MHPFPLPLGAGSCCRRYGSPLWRLHREVLRTQVPGIAVLSMVIQSGCLKTGMLPALWQTTLSHSTYVFLYRLCTHKESVSLICTPHPTHFLLCAGSVMGAMGGRVSSVGCATDRDVHPSRSDTATSEGMHHSVGHPPSLPSSLPPSLSYCGWGGYQWGGGQCCQRGVCSGGGEGGCGLHPTHHGLWPASTAHHLPHLCRKREDLLPNLCSLCAGKLKGGVGECRV